MIFFVVCHPERFSCLVLAPRQLLVVFCCWLELGGCFARSDRHSPSETLAEASAPAFCREFFLLSLPRLRSHYSCQSAGGFSAVVASWPSIHKLIPVLRPQAAPACFCFPDSDLFGVFSCSLLLVTSLWGLPSLAGFCVSQNEVPKPTGCPRV